MNINYDPIELIHDHYPKRGVKYIVDAGYDHMLLNFRVYSYYMYEMLENRGQPISDDGRGNVTKPEMCIRNEDDIDICLEELFTKCREAGINFDIAMAPHMYYGDNESIIFADVNRLTERLARYSVKKCIEKCIAYIVVRPIVEGIESQEIWKYNRDFYLKLGELVRGCNLKILMTNEFRCINGHYIRGICSDTTQTMSYIDELNAASGCERFGLCFDIGNANICGLNMHEYIRKLGQYIKAVILRECDGVTNYSLLPCATSTNMISGTPWSEIVRGLRKIDFDGELIMDIHDSVAAVSHLLRDPLMLLSYKLADYFRWQIGMEHVIARYDSRVLFGAGKMCLNYLKYYGEKYPPLFTCDNNPQVIGSYIESLEVRSPKALSKLPENCAIFICNIYYDEIEKQIRDMGLKNPVERFSDEYLPLSEPVK